MDELPVPGLLPNEGYHRFLFSPRMLLDLSPGPRTNKTRATDRLCLSAAHSCSRSGCKLHCGIRSVGSKRATLRFDRRLCRQRSTRKSTANNRRSRLCTIGRLRCNGAFSRVRQASTEICLAPSHCLVRRLAQARCLFLTQAENARLLKATWLIDTPNASPSGLAWRTQQDSNRGRASGIRLMQNECHADHCGPAE